MGCLFLTSCYTRWSAHWAQSVCSRCAVWAGVTFERSSESLLCSKASYAEYCRLFCNQQGNITVHVLDYWILTWLWLLESWLRGLGFFFFSLFWGNSTRVLWVELLTVTFVNYIVKNNYIFLALICFWTSLKISWLKGNTGPLWHWYH